MIKANFNTVPLQFTLFIYVSRVHAVSSELNRYLVEIKLLVMHLLKFNSQTCLFQFASLTYSRLQGIFIVCRTSTLLYLKKERDEERQ